MSDGILWVTSEEWLDVSGRLVCLRPRGARSTGRCTELDDSAQSGSRDTLDVAAKFTLPLAANGKVFVAGTTQPTAFGLLP